jgi:hypothetical protein
MLSPLLRCPGFDLFVAVVIDWLHAVDLGVLQDFQGNALWELAERMPGSNQDDRVQSVWENIQHKYKEHQVPQRLRLHHLTKNDFRPKASKSPKLKCLGSQSRHLQPILAELLRPWLEQFQDLDMQAIAAAAEAFAQLQEVVASTPYDAARASELTETFSALYQALNKQAEAKGKVSWAVKPKFHMFQELMHFCQELGNPTEYWCYQDETWVGMAARMASARGGHTSPHVAGRRLLHKYIVGEWGAS